MADYAASRRSFGVDNLSPEDFETASIRSAAPSYISDAPSYHTNVSSSEPIPPYSRHDPLLPPSTSTYTSLIPPSTSTPTPHVLRAPTLPPPSPNDAPTIGLPPIPPAPIRHAADPPTLGAFRIPSWSTISSNPAAARHYRSVANRRAVSRNNSPPPTTATTQPAPASSAGLVAGAAALRRRLVLDRIEEEENHRRRSRRPLEDPYLVGEVAARQAREERLARESPAMLEREREGRGTSSILLEDSRRWDWFLGTFAVPARLPSRLNVPVVLGGAAPRARA